jgi:uncharacterized protein YndB with AHSA1/START domain
MTAASGQGTFTIERLLSETPSVVAEVLVNPAALASWWGPTGFTIPSLDFAPAVGSRYRIEMSPPAGEPFFLTGVFREVELPDRIAFTFAWEDPDDDDVETLVEMSFLEVGPSTALTVTQGLFKTQLRLQLHQAGWVESLDKLAAHLLAGRC